ncbi:TetR/AcrR family transcriptional regulator [Nocardioides sp. NPDC051685]|uniref:TetR/AcrR family transcriptional regulator n=1 Tax=Nocardioides sp. NPDC051685 TaxID=3364334 RepID=UPI0037BA101E
MDSSTHGPTCRPPDCPHVTQSVTDERRSELEPREEILDAAACLFVERGFAATPPRKIAEAAGIREPLIRHHFPAGKDEILAELLQRSIRPRLDNLEKIEDLRAATGAGPEALLYTLAVLDARTLARAPHNLGALARQPEAYRQDVGAHFRAAQDELLATYIRLADQVSDIVPSTVVAAPSGYFLGTMLLQQVDGVVEMRSEGSQITPEIEASVAATCLRVCLSDPTRVNEIAAKAAGLIRMLDA